MPAPIGMNFKTSAAGLKRFRSEYLRILSDERQLQEYLRNKKTPTIHFAKTPRLKFANASSKP
jgi:hypothetical protein